MMVKYDYKCDGCQRIEERLVDYEERDEQKCNECGEEMQRLLSAPKGFVH